MVSSSRVSFCRHCGYCAADIFADTSVTKNHVELHQYRHLIYRAPLSIQSMHYAAYVLAVKTNDIEAAAYHLINLEWSRDPARNEQPVRDLRFFTSDTDILATGTLIALCDIARTKMDKESANELLKHVRSRVLDERSKVIVDYIEHLVDKRDASQHTISEAIGSGDTYACE